MVTRILELMITWCLDKWWRGSWNQWCLNVRMKFVGHVSGSCEWSRAKVMWLVGLVTMTLQLPSFLDASSIKCGSRLLINGNSVKNLPTLWGRLRKKTGGKWEHPSPVEKLMCLKGSSHWWKTSQPSYRRLRRKTGISNQLIKNLPTHEKKWGRKLKDHSM